MPDKQSSTDCSACVPGSRLNPHVFEGTFAKQASVRHAIQCYATGHHKVLHAGLLMNMLSTCEHNFLGHNLDAGSHIHMLLFERGFRLPGFHFEQAAELVAGHCQALAVVEVLHVHPEAAIGLNVDEMLANAICVDRFSVRCQPHQFVFATIDFESTVISECRVEQAERMRERDLFCKFNPVGFAHPPNRGTPFTDTIQCQDRSLFERAWKECACGMAFMVFGENQLCLRRPGHFFANPAIHHQLLFQPDGNCRHEAAEAGRSERQVCFQKSFELDERLLVEDDIVQIGSRNARFFQTVFDGI